ncbi:SPCS1 peptidase, partial [Acromyrmex charruanus]
MSRILYIFNTDSEFWNTAIVSNQFEMHFKIRAAAARSMTIHNRAYCPRLDYLERVEVSNRSQIEVIGNRFCQFVFFAATFVYLFTMNAWMQYFKSIPTHMDYDGQARAEKLSRVIITLFGVVGFIWGYAIQQFSQTIYILSAGFVMAALITVPPWPMYRRKPLDWQKPQFEVVPKLKKKK